MQGEATVDNGRKLLEPGDMFGDYTVEKLLGKGGMGAVYLVRAPGGERYAVKLMFPDKVTHDMRRRFANEAEFAIKIRHGNLVSVYDVGEDPETGLCYMIMDYVPGGSLADLLERRGRLSLDEAVSITAQIASALDVAHRNGLVHRDIKPENIMFDADGTPKLADLGVAKFTDDEHKTTVTTTGMIIGTPAYMAPEQMMDSHHVDARADIYALGVVLYEMLTGKRPNEGSTAVELLAKAIKGEPLPDIRTLCPELSASVAHVVSLMCAPKPEARPSTALKAADLLRKAASGKLVLVKKRPSASAADRAAWRAKRNRLLKFATMAVGAAAFLFIGVAGWVKALSRPGFAPQTVRETEADVAGTNVVQQTAAAVGAAETVDMPKPVLAHRWSFNGRTDEECLTDSVSGVVATKIGKAVAFKDGQAVLSGDGHGTGAINLGKGILGGGPATIEIWATRTTFKRWARVFDCGVNMRNYCTMMWNSDSPKSFIVEWYKEEFRRAVNAFAPWKDEEESYIAVTFKAQADEKPTVQWDIYNVATCTRMGNGKLEFLCEDIRISDLISAEFYLGHSHYRYDLDANAKYNEVRIWKGALSDTAIARNLKLGPDASRTELDESVAGHATLGHQDTAHATERAEGGTNETYVSRSAIHAAYRARDRKRAFVEISFCDGVVSEFKNPSGTLARLDEAIAAGVDIMWLHVRSRMDGALVAEGKNGDTLEALLVRGKGKALFKMYAGKSEIDLVRRLNAWESVIFEFGDLDKNRVLLDDEVLGKIRSGELQIMIHPGALGKWSNVTQEFSVWSRSADLKRIGLFGIPQHVESYFGWDPGEAGRTDDETGWSKALSDGITIFRTKSPKELVRFLVSRGVK